MAGALASVGHDLDGELTAVWSGLTTTQQRVLTAIAENTATLYSQAVRARYGLPKTGANGTAIAALADAGEIVRAPGERTGYRVVDPLLALWLRRGRAWQVGD